MIKLSNLNWHAKLYIWTRMSWGRFWFGNKWHPVHRKSFYETHVPYVGSDARMLNTNLCAYLRTLVLYFPLLLLVHLIFAVAITYILFVAPVQFLLPLINFGTVGKVVVWILTILAGGVLFGTCLYLGRDKIKKFDDWIIQKWKNRLEGSKEKVGMFNLMLTYIKDKKEKVCSIMRIEVEKDDEI